jgi:hypothetical protein
MPKQYPGTSIKALEWQFPIGQLDRVEAVEGSLIWFFQKICISCANII